MLHVCAHVYKYVCVCSPCRQAFCLTAACYQDVGKFRTCWPKPVQQTHQKACRTYKHPIKPCTGLRRLKNKTVKMCRAELCFNWFSLLSGIRKTINKKKCIPVLFVILLHPVSDRLKIYKKPSNLTKSNVHKDSV